MDYKSITPEALIRACLELGEEAAWVEFIRRFHPLIARVVLRVSRQWGEASPQVIDDLVQETYLKLCVERASVLRNFTPSYEDSIYGFIKVFTANLVHDYFKASRSQKRGGATITTSIETERKNCYSNSTRSGGSELDRNLLIQEVDSCLRTVASGQNAQRDRHIFWLYYRVGLQASAIAALPMIGLSTKGVESTLLRLTRQIREHLGRFSASEPAAGVSEKGLD